ncbi:MAG: type II toxin-antitoxin system HigB family toxin [Burkholderiales bacterium]|jgi:mRNA interferase HigB
MRLVGRSILLDFARRHPDARTGVAGWQAVISINSFEHWAALKRTFNSVDKVGSYLVFNVCGNKYRLIARVHFASQTLRVVAMLTHREYDRALWRQ